MYDPSSEPSPRNQMTRRQALVAGGMLILSGSIGMALTGAASPSLAEPLSLSDDVDAEHQYQDLLMDLENDLEQTYGETPPDEMSYLEFMDRLDA